jgi:hypothetical protein
MKTHPMQRHKFRLEHQFVEFIPEHLLEGVLYVSMVYATASHLCCCGCGQKVVTALSPTDWQLTFDGRSISLHPSIGNWNFPCLSHYWITRSSIRWAPSGPGEQVPESQVRIRSGKKQSRARKWLTRFFYVRSTE